jgi:hypothetical protein
VLALASPGDGERLEVRISQRDARSLREANARRHEELFRHLTLLGLDPVSLTTADSSAIDRTFLDWASRRRDLRQRR